MLTFETHVNQLIGEGRLGKDEGMAFLGKSISASINAAINPQAQPQQRATPPPFSSATHTNISSIPSSGAGGIPVPPPMKKKA